MATPSCEACVDWLLMLACPYDRRACCSPLWKRLCCPPRPIRVVYDCDRFALRQRWRFLCVMHGVCVGVNVCVQSATKFPKRSGFDVAKDDRSPRSVYNIRGIKKGERDLGTAKLTSTSFGAGLDTVELQKPEFAIEEACKRFYHNGHL